MKGFFRKAKKKAKGVVESMRPSSRQGRSPSPGPSHTPEQPTPDLGANTEMIPAAPGPSTAQPVSSSSSPHVTPAYASPSPPPSALATTGSVIYELLTTIRDGSDMFLPLKAAVVGVLKIWDVCERTVHLNQEFLKHKEKLERLSKITATLQDESRLSDNLRERLEIAAALQDLSNAVQAKLDRGLPSRVLQSNTDIVEVKDLMGKIMSLIDVFEFEGGVRVEIGVEQVKSGVDLIQRGVDQVEDAVQQLQDGLGRSQVEVEKVKDGVDQVARGVDDITRQLWVTKQQQLAKEQEGYLAWLRASIEAGKHSGFPQLTLAGLGKHHVPNAVYDSQRRSGCMEGTRVDVLDRVFRWIRDPKAQLIFWLGGMAGTGKTAIAWSICERVRVDDVLYLGGSFFCSRSTGSATQRDVRCVIPTLAQLFARQSDEFAAALAVELKDEPDLAYKQVKVQIERLLRKPLAALSSLAKTVVFVVDALDECGDQPTANSANDSSGAHAAVSDMLEALIDFSRSSANLPVKFIVTSRPETHIRETSITDTKVTSALHLHTIDKSQVTSDIRLYISKTLSEASVGDAWFTNSNVETLAERADGLFIFAATATKYILDCRNGFREQRLAKLISPPQTNSNALTAPLDAMYALILTEASRSDIMDVDELQQVLKVVAAILSTRMTLSVKALSDLVNLSTRHLRGCLERLHAVVLLPEDDHDASLRTLHASFGDYLFTRAAIGICIAPTLGHDELARGCLRRMARDDFNFNISRSPSSHEPNSETAGDWILLSLRYTCLHWAHHIHSASNQLLFDDAINTVFRPKFLFWLEVLSVLGEVGRASGLLRIASFAVKSAEISRFLRDANSFVASSRVAIEWSAPHIYLSALPFAPKDSLVFQDFTSFLNGVVSVETFGIDRHGGRLIMNLTGHDGEVLSVAYSPDGRLLASGSEDGSVRLWDTLTGEQTMAPLQSDDGAIQCVVFTVDSQRVVSCTDGGLIHIWDLRTGREAMSPLRGHIGRVWSVAHSRDGLLIASASPDNSVRLWNATTGQALAVLTGHKDEVRSVALSSDGNTLASGSEDCTIRLWDVRTHKQQGQPLRGADSWVTSIAFSPDDNFIATGYNAAQQIRIWNVSSGEEVSAPIEAECAISGLAFAPDGSCLASTDRYGIRFWNWKTNQDVVSALSGHSNTVQALSYSPDGLYIATGSGDHTIRIWDAQHNYSMNDHPPSQKHKVNSVAVSVDGSSIVSGSADSTIRVWDPQTAKLALPPLIGHKGEVRSVAVSADGRLIASGSADNTVRLWNSKTGELIGEPLEGHSRWINAVTFSRDVRWLASASSDDTVGLWALGGDQHPTLRQLCSGYQPFSVAFSSDGRHLAVGDYMGYVTVWDLFADGGHITEIARMQDNNSDVRSVCFSPDDSKIAAGSLDNNIYVWDVETMSRLYTLEGHSDCVCAVVYSPDGERIVSWGDDCTARIWDASTARAVVSLRGHAATVGSVAFMSDRKRFVYSADDHGTIQSWDLLDAEALSSQSNLSPVEVLTHARQKDGWLIGASDERLIWLPREYRPIVAVRGKATMLVGNHHVVLSVGTMLHHGKRWAECWGRAKSSVSTVSS